MADTLERLQSALPDRYRIERMLDRGGMAAVFLAQDLKYHPPRRVAIKVLDSEVAAAIGSERFLREIDTVAGLTHPHILPLYDSGAAAGLLYYVMPYVEGESLRRRLQREKQLPLEDALQIAHEVADALDEAHRHGIVHRDVKPENVLLESGHAVVADFGIARAVAAIGTDRLTTSGITVGTPTYMSPEQVVGDGELDGRSDQYALGCLLYEMLAGVPPFTGPTSESLVHQHLNVAPRPVTELRPTVPAGVERVLSKALAKIPADRYMTAAEFAAALAHARESLSVPPPERDVPAAPTGRVPPATPAGFRIRPRLALVTLLVTLLAGALWLLQIWIGPGWPGRPSLAVLDFENATGDSSLAYLGVGLASDVVADLVQRARLNVCSVAEARTLAPEKRAPRSAARALGVRSVLTGTLRPSPAGTQLEVELVNGRSGFTIWSKEYALTPAEAFHIRNEITSGVASRLGAGLGGAGATATSSPPPPPEAYEEYLRGVGALDDFDDPLAPAYATASLDRAVTLAPDFALALAARARALAWRYAHEHDPALLAEAERSANEALRLEPDLVQGRVARARIYRSTNRTPQAAADLDAVLRVNPNWDDAWVEKGRLWRQDQDDFARAEACCRRAISLRPGFARNWLELAICLQFNGRYDDARAAYQKVIELTPDQNRGYEGVATVYMMQKRYAEAIAVYEKLPRSVTDAARASNIATAYFFTGRYKEALRHYLHAVSLEPRTADYRGNLGDCYMRLGRTAEAHVQYLEAVKLDEADLRVSPDDRSTRTDLVMLLAKAGECDRSWSEYQRLEALHTTDNSEVLHQLAKALALCGRRQAAIAALRRMVVLGASPGLFLDEDEFASLRADSGFRALTAKRAR